jgi:pSer/pThr/pTyr-binding forkhead associated (FHA) protein
MRRRRMLVLTSPQAVEALQGHDAGPYSDCVVPSPDVVTRPGPEDDLPMSLPSELVDFCRACGKSEPVRFTVSDHTGTQSPVSELMERPFAVIGRMEECEIRLNHPEVSRRHAYLQMVGGRMYCCDLSSRTGTFLGNRRISRDWVEPGMPVRIGPYLLQWSTNDFRHDEAYDRPGAEDDLVLNDSPDRHDWPYALRCVNARSSSGAPKIRRLRDAVTLVGSHASCDLRLHHAAVARIQCSLIATPGGVWVVDLSLKSRPLVNGSQVAYSRLEEGDELTIGEFRMVFERDQPGGRPQKRLSVSRPGDSAMIPAERQALSNVPPAEFSTPTKAVDQSQLLLTIVDQFTAAQRDMFENTRQMMATMAETFNAAHQRQMDLIRDELMQVHELNRELQQLQRDLLQQKLSATANAGRTPESEGLPSADSLRPGPSPQANVELPPQSVDSTRRAAAQDQPPGDLSPAKVDDNPAPVPAESLSDTSAAPENVPVSRTPDNSPDRMIEQDAPPIPPQQTSAAPSDDEHDLHGWLNDRISKLEKERTGRWQKIMQMLSRSE